MEAIAVVGVELAKSVFQVHALDAQGQALLRKRRWLIQSKDRGKTRNHFQARFLQLASVKKNRRVRKQPFVCGDT